MEYTRHWWRTREGEIITNIPEDMNLMEWPPGNFFLASDDQANVIFSCYG